MSQRNRPPLQVNSKKGPTASKGLLTKPCRSVPAPTKVVQQRSYKSKVCTAKYNDQGGTTDKKECTAGPPPSNPYDLMKSAVQTTINQAQIFDAENRMMCHTLNSSKTSTKIDDCSVNSTTSPALEDVPYPSGNAPSPNESKMNENMEQEKRTNDIVSPNGEPNSKNGGRQSEEMVGNEDDEEYRMEDDEEEEAEMSLSHSQELKSPHSMCAIADMKKSIPEHMRELQVSIMERAAKMNEPANLISYFKERGYFNYNYDQDARAAVGGACIKPKENLYQIVGMRIKKKNHE